MSHWGYVIEQIVQGDEGTRKAQRHYRQRCDAPANRHRWWQVRTGRGEPAVTPVLTASGSLGRIMCARAADLAKQAPA